VLSPLDSFCKQKGAVRPEKYSDQQLSNFITERSPILRESQSSAKKNFDNAAKNSHSHIQQWRNEPENRLRFRPILMVKRI
jgi:hypothetical protein